MADQDITLGEIGRSIDRIETAVKNLAVQMQTVALLTSAHDIKLVTEKERVDDLEKKVDSLSTRAAYISGGVAGIAGLINWFIGRH